MESLVIEGGRTLRGRVAVHGAKNSALPILAATVLGGRSVIHNCPRLSDIDNSLEILRMLGCKTERSGDTVTVEAGKVSRCSIPPELMCRMRSSVIFLGAVLARCGRAVVSAPGGCELGPRPIDLHIDAIRRMGAVIFEERGHIVCESCGRLHGAEIVLPFPSVGATENTMIAASTAKGRTVIIGAAREPEIVDLADMINDMGGEVHGAGGDVIVVDGIGSLGDCEHTCISDRIVASTYIAAAVTTGSHIVVENVKRAHISSVVSAFEEAGCEFVFSDDEMAVYPQEMPSSVREICTMPYPGFPTDAQPVLAAALTLAKGTSVIKETVFGNRFRYMCELVRMGADIRIDGRIAVIRGAGGLCGTEVDSTDLRGGAALVVAGLAAEGRTVIKNPEYIDRGYENIEAVFSALGAEIYRNVNDG